jgi:hypothetical protein
MDETISELYANQKDTIIVENVISREFIEIKKDEDSELYTNQVFMIIQSDKSEMLINDKGEYVMTINKCMK